MTLEIARFLAYLAAVILGVFMTVWGVIHSDAALITSGLALVTTGGLAGGALTKQSGGKYGK